MGSDQSLADFAAGIGLGLLRAYKTDIDVFLLFTAGGLLGTPWRPLRALGGVVTVYTIFRRMDGYVAVTASKVEMLSRVMARSNNPWMRAEEQVIDGITD